MLTTDRDKPGCGWNGPPSGGGLSRPVRQSWTGPDGPDLATDQMVSGLGFTRARRARCVPVSRATYSGSRLLTAQTTVRSTWATAGPQVAATTFASRCSTAAKAPVSYRRRTTGLEHRPSGRPLLDGPGHSAHSYGSEGRARRVPDLRVGRGPSRHSRTDRLAVLRGPQ